jgi:hypothetical protein
MKTILLLILYTCLAAGLYAYNISGNGQIARRLR